MSINEKFWKIIVSHSEPVFTSREIVNLSKMDIETVTSEMKKLLLLKMVKSDPVRPFAYHRIIQTPEVRNIDPLKLT